MEEEVRAHEEKLKLQKELHVMEIDHLKSMYAKQPAKPSYNGPAANYAPLPPQAPLVSAPRGRSNKSRHGSPTHTVRTCDSGHTGYNFNYTYFEPQNKYD